MTSRNTVFGTKVQYEKQQYDMNLRLERMPDLSAQARQPYEEDVRALEVQYDIDRKNAQFAYDTRKTLEEGKKLQETFLSKLAPFSPTIEKAIQLGQESFENFRQQQAEDEAGRRLRLAELEGGLEAMEENYHNPIVKALGDNPEASAHLRSKLFSMDLGMMRRIASAQVKLGAKKYKGSWADFLKSGTVIRVPDRSSPEGFRDMDVADASNAAEYSAVQAAFDNNWKRLFQDQNFPPEVIQEWNDATTKDRQQIRKEWMEETGRDAGYSDRLRAIAAHRGGVPLAQTMETISKTGKLNGKPGSFGYPETSKYVLGEFKKAINVGDMTLADIMRMEQEPSEIKGMTQGKRRPGFFAELKAAAKAYNDKNAESLPDRSKAVADEYVNATARQLMVGGQRPTIEQLQQIEQQVLTQLHGLPAGYFLDNPLWKALKQSYTVGAEDRKTVESRLETFYRERGVLPDEVFNALNITYPGITDRFAGVQEANKKLLNSPGRTLQHNKLQGFAFSSSSGETGGLDLKYDVNGKGVGVASYVIPTLLKEEFDRGLQLRIANGEEITSEVLDQEYARVTKWAVDQRANPNSRMYYDKKTGQYININKYSVVDEKGNSRLLSEQEQIKLSAEGTQKIQDWKSTVATKHGTQPGAFKLAVKDKETMSILFTEEEAMEAYEAISTGMPTSPKWRAVVRTVTGGNHLAFTRDVIKTLTGKDVVFGNTLDNRMARETFEEDENSKHWQRALLNAVPGSAEQRRVKQAWEGQVPIVETAGTEVTDAQQGDATAASSQVTAPSTNAYNPSQEAHDHYRKVLEKYSKDNGPEALAAEVERLIAEEGWPEVLRQLMPKQ